MNKINSAQQRESYDSYNSQGESNDESYEKYGRSSLPGVNTTNKDNSQVNEAVYDRYDTDYEGGENIRPKKSCCKKGRLFNLKNIVGHSRVEYLTQIFFTEKALFKDSHWPRVTNIVDILLNYFSMILNPFEQ